MDIEKGGLVQEWWREESCLHINQKELRAAVGTVQALAKPGDTVHLSVDNTVAYSYLKKQGGRKPVFNNILKPLLEFCHQKNITLVPNLVASQDCLADSISRWPQDRGDYRLDPLMFQTIIGYFQDHICPKVDMFASPGNKQLPLWVGRYPHYGAVGCNALEMPLDNPHLREGIYANPP